MTAAEKTTAALSTRTRMREAELAARNLILRAAYMEKCSSRPRLGSAERTRLTARAQELRKAADALLSEISELSQHLTALVAA
jgi:hypothetical protein